MKPVPLLLLAASGIACTPKVEVDPDRWPTEGCETDAALAWGAVETRRDAYRLVTPDGLELAAGIIRPKERGCWPGLLFVPPGFESGVDEWDDDHAAEIAGLGLVVLTIDVRGRGDSEGEESYVGPDQQDDLAGALAWLAARDDVDPGRVYVRSRSMGVALTAGALDRHPALDPVGWMDIEGPARLPDDLEHADERARETFLDAAEAAGADDDWWADRAPIEHIAAFRGHYRRVQAYQDHALVFYKGHALALLAAAEGGAAAQVDLNGLRPEDAIELGVDDWDPDVVQALALESTVRHDDDRVMDLLLDLLDAPPVDTSQISAD